MSPRALILILSCCALAGSIQLRAFDPLLVSIAHDLEVDVGTVVLLPAVYALAFGFVQLVLGPLSDTIGKTLVIRVCLVVLALFTVVAALARSFEYLILWRILAGAAAGGIVPVCFAIASDRLPELLRRGAINQIIAFSVTGQILAAAAVGFTANSIGWRWVLVVWGLLVALAAVGAAFLLRERSTGTRTVVSVAGIVMHSQAAYARVLSDRRMRPPILVCYFNAVLTVGLIPFISTTLTQASGAQTAGFALALFAAGGIANTAIARILGGQLSPSAYLVAGIGISSCGLIAASILPFWAFIMLPALLGVGFYMTQSSLTVLFGSLGEQQSGTSLSLFMFTFFLGQASGPVVWSFVQARLGISGVGLSAAIGLVLLAIVSWVILAAPRAPGSP